jgi:hypothetical protein
VIVWIVVLVSCTIFSGLVALLLLSMAYKVANIIVVMTKTATTAPSMMKGLLERDPDLDGWLKYDILHNSNMFIYSIDKRKAKCHIPDNFYRSFTELSCHSWS